MGRLCPLLAVLAACAVCAACGSGRHRTAAAQTDATGTSTGTIQLPSTATGAASGAAVFAHSCRSCHSLVGTESLRKQGGDLLGYKLTRAQLISFTRVMPARLTTAQLNAVVDYIVRRQAAYRR